LACNGRDWHTLLESCSVVGALPIDGETVYEPRLTNDRLVLGMKGTISEMEVASFRERAQAELLQKAQRGVLVRRVPIGYVTGIGRAMGSPVLRDELKRAPTKKNPSSALF
jgi:DNA invertase Pin-like site-specific DNA recombinase